MDEYIPTVPAFIAEILTLEKKYGRHYPFKCSGKTRKMYDWYKYHYSRKMKYARLNGWKVESEDKMTNIIKLRFLHDGKAQGREYTYFTPVPVAIGNTVDIDGHKHGIVTAADVPEEKIATFRDRMKTIAGIYEEDK